MHVSMSCIHEDCIEHGPRGSTSGWNGGVSPSQQKFMVQFLFVLVFSIIAVPLPLLIPINDPNAGALGNMSFFYGYNIFVIVY